MNLPDPMHDPHHLRTSQYADDRQLRKRIALHEGFSTNPQSWFEWLFNQIEFPDRPRVLEIGCGTGAFWSENRHRLPSFGMLVVTDLSSGMLASTRQRLNDLVPDGLVADAQHLPFANDSFDVVVANHMLYHVPDIAQAVSEIRRVLAADGQLFAATNGETHMAEMNDLISFVQGRRPNRSIATRFSLENGADVLRRTFSLIERRDFDNDLSVTEVQPVGDYLESTRIEDALTLDQLERARTIVAEAIASDGTFRIRKSTGMLIAR